jgi:GxxExxY protein
MNKYNIYISNNPVIKFPCIRNFRRLTLGARSLSARQLKYIGFKGPGLLEPIYRKCVRRECELRNIPTRYELIVPIEYKGFVFEEPLRLGLLVDDCLIVELKAVEKVLPIHKAQLLSYMLHEAFKQTVRSVDQLSQGGAQEWNPPACSRRLRRVVAGDSQNAPLKHWDQKPLRPLSPSVQRIFARFLFNLVVSRSPRCKLF